MTDNMRQAISNRKARYRVKEEQKRKLITDVATGVASTVATIALLLI